MKTDKFTLFVYCNFLVLLSTPVCSQNINKQNVNTADETLTNYSFLSRYHHTIHTIEFPCLLGHPGYIYIYSAGESVLLMFFFSYIPCRVISPFNVLFLINIFKCRGISPFNVLFLIYCRVISPFHVLFLIYILEGDQSLSCFVSYILPGDQSVITVSTQHETISYIVLNKNYTGGAQNIINNKIFKIF